MADDLPADGIPTNPMIGTMSWLGNPTAALCFEQHTSVFGAANLCCTALGSVLDAIALPDMVMNMVDDDCMHS